MKEKPDKLTITKRQFVRYVKGDSLRTIGKDFGVSKETIRYHFLKHIHPNYNVLAKTGVCGEIKRYLLSRHHSDRTKETIQTWFLDNLDSILALDDESELSFFTENKTNQLTRAETGRYSDLSTWTSI